MSTITSSYTVTPNEPTPNVSLSLLECDQVARLSHSFTVYIYKVNDQNKIPNVVDRMRDSLSKILVHYYPLSGRLHLLEGGRVEINCNAKGVTFIEALSPKTMAEYGDFAPNETLTKELIPHVDYSQPFEEIPLLLVQLTRFQGTNHEGLAIGIAISHVTCDGSAAIQFINTWAKLSRGEMFDSNEMSPYLDRSVMNSTYPPRPPRFDHPEFKPALVRIDNMDTKQEQKNERTALILKLTSNQVAKLKTKANDDPSLKEVKLRPYSRYEAIAGHVWKCASKARKHEDLQPTLIRVTADFRNRLNPPLPRNYFGNALVWVLSPICMAGELISKPLSYGAQNVRKAIELLNDEYIRSQLDFVRNQERVDWIRYSCLLNKEKPKNATTYGDPNLSIVSWLSMPVYEADFGLGKPVHFGPGVVFPDGKCYLIRSPYDDGSLFVCIHLYTAHAELFKKFFYEDI